MCREDKLGKAESKVAETFIISYLFGKKTYYEAKGLEDPGADEEEIATALSAYIEMGRIHGIMLCFEEGLMVPVGVTDKGDLKFAFTQQGLEQAQELAERLGIDRGGDDNDPIPFRSSSLN